MNRLPANIQESGDKPKNLLEKSENVDKSILPQLPGHLAGKKRIIKKIVHVNPEQLKNLGITDQIAAAVKKLDANNALPPSINIDLSKTKVIKSEHQLPSTSKAAIKLPTQSSNHHVKDTLNKFLQDRLKVQNVQQTKNVLIKKGIEYIKKSQELTEQLKKKTNLNYLTVTSVTVEKPVAKRVEPQEPDILTENDEEILMDEILYDSEGSASSQGIEIFNKIENCTQDNKNIVKSFEKNKKQNLVDESTKIVIIKEPQTIQKLKTNEVAQLNKTKNEPIKMPLGNSEIRTTITSEVRKDTEKANKNILNLPVDEKVINTFSLTDTEIIPPHNKDSKDQKQKVLVRRRKVVPVSVMNLKKSQPNTSSVPVPLIVKTIEIPKIAVNQPAVKPKALPTNSMLNQLKTRKRTITDSESAYVAVNSKVVVNIQGEQIDKYAPVVSKRKIEEIPQHLQYPPAQIVQSRIANKSKTEEVPYITENVINPEDVAIDNMEAGSSDFSPIKDEPVNEEHCEDAVDFLLRMGDTIRMISGSDSENFTDDGDDDDDAVSVQSVTDILDKNNSNEIDSPDFDAITPIKSNNSLGNFQLISKPFDKLIQEEDQNLIDPPLYNNELLSQMSVDQERPVVIENKILLENEKIDVFYLKNIPHFETPTKSDHEIGQTVVLKRCDSDLQLNANAEQNKLLELGDISPFKMAIETTPKKTFLKQTSPEQTFSEQILPEQTVMKTDVVLVREIIISEVSNESKIMEIERTEQVITVVPTDETDQLISSTNLTSKHNQSNIQKVNDQNECFLISPPKIDASEYLSPKSSSPRVRLPHERRLFSCKGSPEPANRIITENVFEKLENPAEELQIEQQSVKSLLVDAETLNTPNPININKNTEVTFKTPEVTLENPELTLETPGVTLENPELTLVNPELTLETPQVMLETPQVMLENPELTLVNPELTLVNPELTLETPQVMLETTEVILESPEVTFETVKVPLNEEVVMNMEKASNKTTNLTNIEENVSDKSIAKQTNQPALSEIEKFPPENLVNVEDCKDKIIEKKNAKDEDYNEINDSVNKDIENSNFSTKLSVAGSIDNEEEFLGFSETEIQYRKSHIFIKCNNIESVPVDDVKNGTTSTSNKKRKLSDRSSTSFKDNISYENKPKTVRKYSESSKDEKQIKKTEKLKHAPNTNSSVDGKNDTHLKNTDSKIKSSIEHSEKFNRQHKKNVDPTNANKSLKKDGAVNAKKKENPTNSKENQTAHSKKTEILITKMVEENAEINLIHKKSSQTKPENNKEISKNQSTDKRSEKKKSHTNKKNSSTSNQTERIDKKNSDISPSSKESKNLNVPKELAQTTLDNFFDKYNTSTSARENTISVGVTSKHKRKISDSSVEDNIPLKKRPIRSSKESSTDSSKPSTSTTKEISDFRLHIPQGSTNKLDKNIRNITNTDIVTEINRPETATKTTDDNKSIKSIEGISSQAESSERNLKKRGRKPNTVNEEIPPQNDNSKPVKSQRKNNDRSLHPRLLLVTKRDDIDKNDQIDRRKEFRIVKSTEIRCGMCKMIVAKKMWEKHKSLHYGLGWKDNEEPINLSSFCEVLKSLLSVMKKSKIRSFKCRMCSKSLSSALGIISHLEVCGLTEDQKRQSYIKCEHCDLQLARTSMPNHLKYCKELNVSKKGDNSKELIAEKEVIVVGNMGRLKRQSMLKAENKFKEIEQTTNAEDPADLIQSVGGVRGGQFRSWKKDFEQRGFAYCIGASCKMKFNDMNGIREHVKICKNITRSGYRCRKCKYHSETVENVREHILLLHKPQVTKDYSCSESDFSNNESSDESSDHEKNVEIDEYGSTDGNRTDNDTISSYKRPKRNFNITNNTSQLAESPNPLNSKNKILIENARSDFHSRSKYMNWTKSFQDHHLSIRPLFIDALPVDCRNSISSIDSYEPKNYLSIKFTQSDNKLNSKFGGSKQPEDWRQLASFSSIKQHNEELIFIGGPITALKWLPTDNNLTTPQYLAIAYKYNFNRFVRAINPKKKKTLILIYNVGHTNEFLNANLLGEIEYGVTFDNGPINDIEFLPSGGYYPNKNRLGLLAVAGTHNDVFIYSLPIKAPKNCDKTIYKNINLIDLNCVYKLKLKLTIDKLIKTDYFYNVHCTRLCWSKAKGHNMLVSGYSNGSVAIWNLDRVDNINLYEENGIQTFLPINYFSVSYKSITGVDLHYDRDRPRWLQVTAINRTVKIMDIEDPCDPIHIYGDDLQKSFTLCGEWPNIWENPAFGLSDDLVPSTVTLVSPLGLNFRHRRLGRLSTSINDISFLNWKSVMALGSINGDFSIELTSELNLDATHKRAEIKWFSYTDLISLDGSNLSDTKLKLSNHKLSSSAKQSNSTKNSTKSAFKFYESDYRKKYGIVFGKMQYFGLGTEVLSTDRNPPLHMNCYVQINRVHCNNNENGRQLFAFGYENGFVRIIYNDIKSR